MYTLFEFDLFTFLAISVCFVTGMSLVFRPLEDLLAAEGVL